MTSLTGHRDDRAVYALRQFAVIAAVLLLLASVAGRIEPLPNVVRGIGGVSFLWSIPVWAVVFWLNARRPDARLEQTEGWPMLAALIIAAVGFVIGLFAVDAVTRSRQIFWVVIQAVSLFVFWWGLLSIWVLATNRAPDGDGPLDPVDD